MNEFSPELVLARDQTGPDRDRRQLARSAAAGTHHRLARGAYVPAEEWTRLDLRHKYLARIVAASTTLRSRPVISHVSAAAIWNLPNIVPWPQNLHVTVHPLSNGRSRNGIVRHLAALKEEDVVEVAGLYVTSLSRTILDIAATAKFMEAVVMADFALHVDRFGRQSPLATREVLEAAWERAMPLRAHSRTRAVLAFAETQADSPLESVSRVNMRLIGVLRPRLQVPHYDSQGFIGECDFTWESYGQVAEADGDKKYLDPEFRRGRTVEQVLLDEKKREDRLRALPRGVSRWPWSVGIDAVALRQKLVRAGLPTGQKW
jgi:hypothetical protein